MLLVGAAAPARAERFEGMKYLGGFSRSPHKQLGALVLEGGELRFEDRKGRIVFVLPLAAAQAWVGAETRTTAASILRSGALMMVAIPLSVGQADPMQAWSRDMTPILVVDVAEGAGSDTLRWRGPSAQLRDIAEAINRAAKETAMAVP
jgi:hypothetical protein